MSMLQIRNDSKFDAAGSQWLLKRGLLLYFEYYIHMWRTKTSIELSCGQNITNDMKYTIEQLKSVDSQCKQV